MITQDDIDRFEQMQEAVGRKTIVIDTMQYFEIEIPQDVNPHEWLKTEGARQACADLILSGACELSIVPQFDDE